MIGMDDDYDLSIWAELMVVLRSMSRRVDDIDQDRRSS